MAYMPHTHMHTLCKSTQYFLKENKKKGEPGTRRGQGKGVRKWREEVRELRNRAGLQQYSLQKPRD